jgi:arabinose-5-phosphate isomerase
MTQGTGKSTSPNDAECSQSDELDLARQVLRAEAQSIEAARKRLGPSFIKALDLMAAAPLRGGKVVVTGVGKSGKVAAKVAATLSSTGTLAVFMHPTEAAHGDLGMVTSKDTVLCFSQSGNSEEILRLLPHWRRLGVALVMVAGNIGAPLARGADAVISSEIEAEACPHNLAPTSSTTVAIALGDALALCLSKRWDFKPEQFAAIHPAGALGRRLTLRVNDLMKPRDALGLVRPESTMNDTVAALTKTALGAVVVTDENYSLIGIITDGDIRRALQKREAFFALKAQDIMTRGPIYVEPDTMAIDALKLMENRPSQISILPVVSGAAANKTILGLVRLHDLIGQF